MKTFPLIIFLSGILVSFRVEAQGNRSRKDAVLVEQFKSENSKLLTDDYLRTDNFAIGVLKASKWNTSAATRFLKKLLAWRASNKINQLGESPADPDMLKLFPYRLSAVTKEGCPVLELDAGKWLVVDFMLSYDYTRDAIDVFMKHVVQMFEKPRTALNKLAPQCDQAIMIINGRGFTAKNYAEPNVISSAIRVSTNVENYYPNLYKKIIIINSNQDMTNLLNIGLPYLATTSSAIRVFSENEEDQARQLIYQHIEPDQLTI